VGAEVSLHRQAARRDANEPEIVQALRSAGAVVWQLPKPFDLLVGFSGWLVGLEVKGPKGKLTPEQREDFALARDRGLPIFVVRTPEEALKAIGATHG
jgi:hypothetical protein